LQVSVPLTIVPAFELALLMGQKKFAEVAEYAGQPIQAEVEGPSSVSPAAAIAGAIRNFRGKLIEALDALAPDSSKYQKFNLSLIEDEQMQTQLACEKLVERLTYLQRKGLLALDQRLCKTMELAQPLGPKLPVSPQILADAARESLAEAQLSDEFMSVVITDFDVILDPVLSDLLKDYNAGLAAAGVLPNLIIQDEEERIRRQTIKTPALTTAKEGANTTEHNDDLDDGTGSQNQSDAQGGGGNYDRSVGETDRELFNGLIEQMKNLATRNPAPPPTLPQREMAKSETLAMLDKLQHSKGNINSVLATIGKEDGSIADAIKRELSQTAEQEGITFGEEQAVLAPEEDTAVELAGNLFDVMLKDRPNGDAVAAVLSQMVMPFVRAAVSDPQLFLERHHPARQLLNTMSEACEDNLGETPHERDLLGHVENAAKQVGSEYTGDNTTFQTIEAKLSSQMETHRKRVQMSEKRAGEAQQGQERLEVARMQATTVVNNIVRSYAFPTALRSFFNTEWLHHLSVTALRKGKDSDAFTKATRIAQPWIDLLDMASLGEPLPMSHLDTLEESTKEVLASSGVQDDAGQDFYQNLINAVSEWTEEIVTPPEEQMSSFGQQLHVPAAAPVVGSAAASSNTVAAAVASLEQADVAVAEAPIAPPEPDSPPTEAELEEVATYVVGTWLQLPKADGGFQQLKVSWISGISGSIMLVNRRGARVLVLSPAEMVDLKRRNELLVFESESPVDQAMRQLLDKLKRE
ncbi:MAG: DUF1631 family protein, partial [Arenimonas sp.]